MRTLGETRLWYAFFLPLIGFVVYHSRKYSWMIFYSIGLAALFLSLNFFKPELFNKALMPALQSVWFVPHVIVYMLSYALLAASSLVALRGLWSRTKSAKIQEIIRLADDLVYLGFGFLSLGLIFGALWAKEAWGHYWTWDPKETWAFLTWICYLGYIHFRYYAPKNTRVQLWILAFAFVVLLMCWFGINYLPSAANSVHTYGQ